MTEKEKLTLVRLSEKKVGDKMHFEMTSSQINFVKRHESITTLASINLANQTGNCRHRKICDHEKDANRETPQEDVKAQESKRLQMQKRNKEISRYNKLAHSLRGIGIAYFVQCLLRLLIDIGFTYLQHQLFLFDVPEIYKCKRWPCPNTVSLMCS